MLTAAWKSDDIFIILSRAEIHSTLLSRKSSRASSACSGPVTVIGYNYRYRSPLWRLRVNSRMTKDDDSQLKDERGTRKLVCRKPIVTSLREKHASLDDQDFRYMLHTQLSMYVCRLFMLSVTRRVVTS